MKQRSAWLYIPLAALCLLDWATAIGWRSLETVTGLTAGWILLFVWLLRKVSNPRAAIYLSTAVTLFHAWGIALRIDNYPGGDWLSLLFCLLTALLLIFAWEQVTTGNHAILSNLLSLNTFGLLRPISFVLFLTMLIYGGSNIRSIMVRSAEHSLSHFLSPLSFQSKLILCIVAALFVLINLRLFSRHRERRPAIHFLRKSLVKLYVAAFFIGLYLCTPPFSPVLTAKRPIINKIPDDENAWTDYRAALRVIGDFEPQPLPYRSPNLDKFARGETELDDNQKAYMEKNLKAIDYLEEFRRVVVTEMLPRGGL